MNIAEIAVKYGVSVKTAQRRMKGYPAKVKPHPVNHAPTKYYLKGDVTKAFKPDLTTRKGIDRTMAHIRKMDAKQKGTKGR